MERRHFLKLTGAAGALALGTPVLSGCEAITRVDFGPLEPSAVPNLFVPAGFTARRLATTGAEVLRGDGSGTGYTWHANPDGGACFPILAGPAAGGWVYTSNSESLAGGAGALAFDSTGAITGAYSILSGSIGNCAGGVVWVEAGLRWISCEEFERGRAFECDPYQAGQGVAREAMGRFYREAVAMDPAGKRIYQTEDRSNGGLYRFTPTTWGDLSAGLLEVMIDLGGGAVGWAEVPDPSAPIVPTRNQTPVGGGTIKRFNGGEGISCSDGIVWFSTKGDNRVWRYQIDTGALTVAYDDTDPFPAPRHLTGVDNVTVASTNRVFVAEDGGNMEIVGLDVATGATYPVVRYDVSGSEVTGPAFSPDGTRLYFSSQRVPGETFEVTGPWNRNAVTAA